MSKPHLLIIEDEPKIAKLLTEFLEFDGYKTSIVEDGAFAISAIKKRQPDCVILDLMLPNKDGLTICNEVRAFSDLPIIMLTARIDEIDRLKGLKSGADDYVCKPFSPKEVVARVEAVLRRVHRQGIGEESQALTKNGLATAQTFSYKDIFIDENAFSCRINNKTTELTPVEFRLLLALVKSPNIVLSREQLISHCYTDNRVVSDRTIDSHMKNIKHKLHDASPEQTYVQAVYGVGYKMV